MSDDLSAWHARARVCRDGLHPLAFLVGSFEGRGLDHGEPVLARAEGRLRLDGSWLELHDRLFDPQGQPLYEDFALYRFDPAEGGLRVLHFLERSWHSQYPVHLVDDALHWTTGVGGPRVVLSPTPTGWRSEVTMPEDTEPSVVLEYRRVNADEPSARSVDSP
jgi:hypothetical protein